MARITRWQRNASMAIAGGLAALAASMAAPAMAKDTYKIGVVVPFSGVYAYFGEEAKRGYEIAIEERASKVLGVPIAVQWEDTETKPQVAVQKGIKAITDGAEVIFGAGASSETLALAKIVSQRKVPMVVTISGDPSLTGDQRSHYVFRTTKSTTMETKIAIEGEKKLGLKHLYSVVADYSVTRGDAERFKAALPSGAIVGEDITPIGTKDFSVIVNRIANSGADGVAVFLAGGDTITFLKQAEEIKLRNKVKFIGAYYIDNAAINAVGEGALGAVSTPRWDYKLDYPDSKAFFQKYKEKYGKIPTFWAAEAYDGMKWWLQTVDKTQSWDKETWITAFETSDMDNAVVGKRTMRACDHQASMPGFLAEVVKGATDTSPYEMNVIATYAAKDITLPCPQ
jgi:ABC-type branched-subunit amino acid transport system substrate-binding protein